MQLTCTCGNRLHFADNLPGQPIKCPHCGEYLQLLQVADEHEPPPISEDDDAPRLHRPEKIPPLVLLLGLGSGAILVAGVTVAVVLLVKRSPHAPPTTSATAAYQYPAGVHTEKNVYQLAYSPDGRFLATVSPDPRSETTPQTLPNLVKVWDLDTKEVVAQFSNDFFNNYTLTFSPNGKLLAVGGWGRVELWDLEKKALRHKDKLDGGNPKLGEKLLAFNPDGDLLVYLTEGLVCLMDVESGKVDRQPVHLNFTAGVAHVPGKPIIAIATTLDRRAGRGQIALYNYRTQQNSPTKELPILGSSIAFSRDGSVLAAASGGIRVFDTKTWDEKTALRRLPDKGTSQSFAGYVDLAVSRDGGFVVGINAVTNGEQCEYWATAGQVTRALHPSEEFKYRACRHFALSPDDKTIALLRSHEGVSFVDVATGKEIRP